MTAPCTRARRSIAVTVVTLALGACTARTARPPIEPPRPDEARLLEAVEPATIRFDNGAREHVHVYLVGEQREWLLGRIEPGARAVLRIPEASLAGNPAFVRLAVLAGGRQTAAAARDPRAAFTIPQPAATLLTQRWAFAQGQLTSLSPR